MFISCVVRIFLVSLNIIPIRFIMLFLRLMRFKTILLHPACLQTVLTSPVIWFLGSDTALILLTLYIFSIQCISSYLLSDLTV